MRSNSRFVVAVFESHDQPAKAMRELRKHGFDMKNLSVGEDCFTKERTVGYYNAANRIAYWGKLGAFWGGLWGLLLGFAFLWAPGIGQLPVAGPTVLRIVGALELAVVTGGFTAFGAALVSLGIPHNSIVQYKTEVKKGRHLLVVKGTGDEVERARDLLHKTGAKKTMIQAKPAVLACSRKPHKYSYRASRRG